jgi:2-octaprenylphenol hydroxylase
LKSHSNVEKSKTLLPQRALAITSNIQSFLVSLGVWPETSCVGYMREIQVFEALKPVLHFNSRDVFEPTLAYVVDESVLQAQLFAQVLHTKNIVCLENTIEQLEYVADGVVLHCDSGDAISAQLVIAADGAHSPLRTLSGLSVQRESYDQKSIIAVLQTECPHHDTGYQHFVGEDIIAFLPLADPHQVALVWSSGEADTYLSWDNDVFAKSLMQWTTTTLGNISLISERATYPLAQQYAPVRIADRLVLVGDAAQVVHPLAGQGVNIGLMDVNVLASLLADRKVKDVGNHLLLARFSRARAEDRWMRTRGIHAIKGLFAQNNKLCQTVRRLGFQVFQNWFQYGPSLKKQLIRYMI